MELTRNIVYYDKKGKLFIKPIASYGIEITAIDHGPGIPNLLKTGLGLGLSGVKRLMDEFGITSTVGLGTKVKGEMVKRRAG